MPFIEYRGFIWDTVKGRVFEARSLRQLICFSCDAPLKPGDRNVCADNEKIAVHVWVENSSTPNQLHIVELTELEGLQWETQ